MSEEEQKLINKYNELISTKYDIINNVIKSNINSPDGLRIIELLSDALNMSKDDMAFIYLSDIPYIQNDIQKRFFDKYNNTMSKEAKDELINKYDELISTKSDIISNVFKNNIHIIKSGDVIKFTNLLSIALKMSKDDIERIFFNGIPYIDNDIQNRFINPIIKTQKKKNLIYLIVGIIILVVFLYILFKKTKKNKRY